MIPAPTRQGISLTEVMVATVIFMFVMAGLYTTLSVGTRAWQSHQVAVQAQQDVSNAVMVMSRDFRVADNIIITPVAGGLWIAFQHPDEGTVNYRWETTGPAANQLVRQTAQRERTIARHITFLSLRNGPRDVLVTVAATVGARDGGQEFRVEKKIAKRSMLR